MSSSSILKGNVFGIIIADCIGFTFLSLAISIISFVGGIPSLGPFKQWIIIFASGVITVVLLIIGMSVALISSKKGFDPDNFMSPILTTLSDVIGMLLLMRLIILI